MEKILDPSFVLALLLAILKAFAESLPKSLTQLVIAGKTMSVAEVIAKVQEYLGLYQGPVTGYRAWRDSIQLRDDKAEEVGKFLGDLEKGLSVALGWTPQEMSVFGFNAPKERRQLTAEEMAARSKKALATRKARGTMGKRQKEKIRGADAQPKQGN